MRCGCTSPTSCQCSLAIDPANANGLTVSGTGPASDPWVLALAISTDLGNTLAVGGDNGLFAGVAAPVQFTPTVAASTSNPTITYGSGSSGWYSRDGDWVDFIFSLILGGTITGGSGTWRVTLPIPGLAMGTDTKHDIGDGHLWDASAGQALTCAWRFIAGATAIEPVPDLTASAFVDLTHPWTWSTSDELRGHVRYPAA